MNGQSLAAALREDLRSGSGGPGARARRDRSAGTALRLRRGGSRRSTAARDPAVYGEIDRDPAVSKCPGLADVRLPNPLDRTLFDEACFLNAGAITYT